MPQKIYSDKAGNTPLSHRGTDAIIDNLIPESMRPPTDAFSKLDQNYQATELGDLSRYFNVKFDPTVISDSTGASVYENVFSGWEDKDGNRVGGFEDLYFNHTGTRIDLTKGPKLAKGYDRKKDLSKSNRRMHFESRIVEESEKSIPYSQYLGKSQKDRHIERWTEETQGLVEYLEQYIPPANTIEGQEMADSFYEAGGFLDTMMDKYSAPMVKNAADMLGEYHSVDTAGDYGKRALGSFEKTWGGGLIGNKDLLAKMAKFVEPLYSAIQPGVIDKTVTEYADEIMKTGKFISDKGSVRYEEADPVRGIYAQPMTDRGMKAFIPSGYMVYKATESIGSQILTTGLGVSASAIAQLHPYARQAGTVARTAIGIGASLPGVAAGYILETGDAYNSSLEELTKIRQEAIDIKNNDKKAWENGGKERYGVPFFNYMSADMLSDKQIEEFAGTIAREYGVKSSLVELGGTAFSAGIAVRAAAKQLGLILKTKEAQHIITKSITRNAMSNLKAGGVGFAGTAFTEALTEGIQEYIQESILAKELPTYEINMSQVYDAAYAGGLFGGGMSASGSAVSSYKGYRDQKLNEETAEQKNIRAAKEIKKGKSVKEFDEAIIGASLLGDSLEDIVEKLSGDDNSPAALELQNQLRGRYTVLQQKIDEISNDPARAAGFLKKYKADLELMDFQINEKSLGNLVLQPEQIAEILGIEVEQLGSDEVIPKKYGPRTKSTVDQQNIDSLEEEFGEQPDQDLSSIDQYDPDFNTPLDPTLGILQPDFIDGLIEQADQNRITQIDVKIAELKDLSLPNHLSPLDREVAIEKLEADKAKIMGESTTIVTPGGIHTNYKTLKVSEMKEIALARELDIKEQEGSKRAGKDLLRADLITLLEESDLETKPKTISEAGLNHAKNIIGAAASAVQTGALPNEIIMTFDDDLLINHAKNIAVDATPFIEGGKLIDKEGLQNAIFEQQGPTDFNMGIPLFFKQKNKSTLHRTFRQGYYELLKKVPDLGSSEGLFRKWVEEHVGPNLPEHLRAIFYDWANTFAPNQTLAGDIAYAIYDKFRGKQNLSPAFQSDMKDIEAIFIENTDWTLEAIGQQNTEGADIHTENFTHLNSAFFEAMDVVLKKDDIDNITELAKNSASFEDFVTSISSNEIDLRDADGLTAANLVANNSPLKRKLKQFYVSNLVENLVIVNDLNLGEGQYKDSVGGGKTVQLIIPRAKAGRMSSILQMWIKMAIERIESLGMQERVWQIDFLIHQ